MRGPARTALAAYDLPAVKLTASPRGLNTTFRVDAAEGGRYVLRVQRPDGPSVPMARSKMTWLAALRRNTGLVVPRAVRTRSGNGLTVIEDPAAVPTPRSCVLYRSVEGRFLDSTLTERHLHKVGPFTARLQSPGRRWPAPRASNAGR